jgi:hypothetical protein
MIACLGKVGDIVEKREAEKRKKQEAEHKYLKPEIKAASSKNTQERKPSLPIATRPKVPPFYFAWKTYVFDVRGAVDSTCMLTLHKSLDNCGPAVADMSLMTLKSDGVQTFLTCKDGTKCAIWSFCPDRFNRTIRSDAETDRITIGAQEHPTFEEEREIRRVLELCAGKFPSTEWVERLARIKPK